jgi:hypothetical protein
MYSKNHFHVGKLRTMQANSRLSLFCDERKCQIFKKKHDTNIESYWLHKQMCL